MKNCGIAYLGGHYLRFNKAVDGTILNFYVKKRKLIDRFKYCKNIQVYGEWDIR
jgi:hypothetical protein